MLKHKNNKLILLAALYFAVFISYAQKLEIKDFSSLKIGAQQFDAYVSKLKNKRVAIVTNQTGVINNTSIVDTLLKLNIPVKKILGPEHGFRGNTEAGEKVNSNTDKKTGLPVISLYGANKKPSAKDLLNIDVVIYDIQDIGVRFYTYISTMCYVMEACAENNIEVMILDRPNPNGFYIDGPVMQDKYKGFLGLHNVPIVYGMTCGEYALMANGEGWLKNKIKCKLTVVPCEGYDRKASYKLPVHPSPNIPNIESVLLYPNLGVFEGTIMSLGRGTKMPFQVIGHPDFPDTSFSFTPLPSKLSAAPKYVNQKCYGLNLLQTEYLLNHPRKIDFAWLFFSYFKLNKPDFFNRYFNAHSGNDELQEQVKKGFSELEVRASWESDLANFKKTRAKYLIYKDF